jgi:hypothetical protein
MGDRRLWKAGCPSLRGGHKCCLTLAAPDALKRAGEHDVRQHQIAEPVLRYRVTSIGGIAAALMVVLWVGGIALGFFFPSSWLGVIIYAPLGLAVYIFVVAGVFAVAGSFAEAKGWPFLKKGDDVA